MIGYSTDREVGVVAGDEVFLDSSPMGDPLLAAAGHARKFLDGVAERPVAVPVDAATLRAALDHPLGDRGLDPTAVIDALVRDADAGVTATAGPRYFGFVIGGSLPAALAADWLVSAWDQCAGFYVLSPAAAVIEEITARWLLELLGLPATASVGFVTGAQSANTTALAAARHHVLAAAGWDVEQRGLFGAPTLTVLVGADAHTTIFRALRLLGLGSEPAVVVAADEQGRMKPEALREALSDVDGPAIVCAQAGDVNSGAVDPLGDIADVCEGRAWLHVDGAFGLWASAAPSTRPLMTGVARADSWAVDAHKWLNVPYDSAAVIVAHPKAHVGAMSLTASYLATDGIERDASNFVPESSRRARALPIYAALRSLGRRGVAELVERNCGHARHFAERLRAEPEIEVLNDVVLNQVLVRVADDDDATRRVIGRVQQVGTCWIGGTVWKERAAIRISVSNWSTSEDDVEQSAEAIIAATRQV
jgi:glutamate/tyrosine decarboxylase-like PLP-dependent enzyme